MNPIECMLQAHGVMILDGAMATELEARGCDLADELWSAKILLERPEEIAAVHMDYFLAGADCAVTASYQATVEGFARRGISGERARELLRDSVRLACGARDRFWADPEHRAGRGRPLVAASIGPYGAYLADGSEYRGGYRIGRAELAEFHRERMRILAEGADLLACETIPCLEEAVALAELAERETGLFCWVTFSCRDGGHISDGASIEECARALERFERVAAVGVNCTAPEYVEELIVRLRGATSKPVAVYPNSGEQYDPASKTWHGGADGPGFGERAAAWYRAGGRLIGGCCRTTPEDIRRAAGLLRSAP